MLLVLEGVWGEEVDGEGDGDGAEEVGDEVPGGVGVATDVGAGKRQRGEEFDDFVDGTEAGSRGDAKSEKTEGGFEGESASDEGGPESLPADPGDEREAIEMDELVELEPAGDDPPVVEDS